MPAKKTRRRATAPEDRPVRETRPSHEGTAPARGGAIEDGLNLWTRYARETGETVTEFLRRFGEEQQKSYEAWATGLSETMRPAAQAPEARATRTRLDDWNRRAEELGSRVREAFEATLKPQRELFELWARPFLAPDAGPAETSREVTELVQKLWTGLTVDLSRRLLDTMQPGRGFEDFVRAQDEATKQFTENFQKLARIYFTSPAFVTAFGKTLDSSLDLQKNLKDSDELFRKVTGLPTRQEISELNQSVRDLSQQVSRLHDKRS